MAEPNAIVEVRTVFRHVVPVRKNSKGKPHVCLPSFLNRKGQEREMGLERISGKRGRRSENEEDWKRKLK